MSQDDIIEEGADASGDDELLREFQAEVAAAHREYRAVIQGILERIRERKLKALKEEFGGGVEAKQSN